MTALNPLMRIEDQIVEVFEAHDLLSPTERRARALELAREVGLPDPERIYGLSRTSSPAVSGSAP